MRALRACWRFVHAVAHALRGFLTIVLRFPSLTVPERNQRVQDWARAMLVILGIELRVTGNPPQRGPVLLVANHISWLDILVMHAARHCRFVSKHEVRDWPLVGRLATGGGTLYIERASRRDAMRVVHHMAEALQAGDILAVFPEGTTSDGTQLLPFHANLLQAAVAVDAPVQPVALTFRDRRTNAISQAARYVGDDTLVGSVWGLLTSDPVVAVVAYGEPQHAQGRDRRAWAADLREAVQALRG